MKGKDAATVGVVRWLCEWFHQQQKNKLEDFTDFEFAYAAAVGVARWLCE
jgi:hypothetical protein